VGRLYGIFSEIADSDFRRPHRSLKTILVLKKAMYGDEISRIVARQIASVARVVGASVGLEAMHNSRWWSQLTYNVQHGVE